MAIPVAATDVITILDSKSKELASIYTALGLGLAGEVGTAAATVALSNKSILGNGSAAFPGIANAELKASLSAVLSTTVQRLRWDTLFQGIGGAAVKALDAQVLATVPAGWTLTGPGSPHPLNNYLLRANGAHAGAPAAPAAAGTLTGTTTAAGAMPLTTAGNAPRFVHTLVGANEWDESLPSAEATQVALTGSMNAYSYQIGGNVPAGVTAVKLYRGYFLGGVGFYYLDQKVAVTATAAFPALVATQSDAALNAGWSPPAWLSCLLRPEAAALVALAYAITGQTGIPVGQPMPIVAANMTNPANVLLGPSNGFLGLGNPVQGAQFGLRIVGSAFASGVISTLNNAPTGIQGFAGAIGLQARVTTPLDAAGTLSMTYAYYDAAHGYGNVQTATTAAVAFSGTGVGSLAVPVIPAGRLVISVSADAPTGQTSGAWIWEATSVRP
jgi:hypothetical protein